MAKDVVVVVVVVVVVGNRASMGGVQLRALKFPHLLHHPLLLMQVSSLLFGSPLKEECNIYLTLLYQGLQNGRV